MGKMRKLSFAEQLKEPGAFEVRSRSCGTWRLPSNISRLMCVGKEVSRGLMSGNYRVTGFSSMSGRICPPSELSKTAQWFGERPVLGGEPAPWKLVAGVFPQGCRTGWGPGGDLKVLPAQSHRESCDVRPPIQSYQRKVWKKNHQARERLQLRFC